MTQWYLRFRSENEKIFELFRALTKKKIDIPFVRMYKEEFPLKKRIANLAKLNKIPIEIGENTARFELFLESVDLGWHIHSSIYVYNQSIKTIKPSTRFTMISIVGADRGLRQELHRIIELAGTALEPYEFEVVCEEEGPEPVYKGKWDLDVFNKKILPKIEFNKNET